MYNAFSEVKLKKAIYVFIIFLVIISSIQCTVHYQKQQINFANKLAKEELWQEAYTYWYRAMQNGHHSSAIYNNIAVALENMGQLSEADIFYQKALKIAPTDNKIISNYDKFKKIFQTKDTTNEANKKNN
jgi:tetratricopeptide (TPR) repeat protein